MEERIDLKDLARPRDEDVPLGDKAWAIQYVAKQGGRNTVTSFVAAHDAHP